MLLKVYVGFEADYFNICSLYCTFAHAHVQHGLQRTSSSTAFKLPHFLVTHTIKLKFYQNYVETTYSHVYILRKVFHCQLVSVFDCTYPWSQFFGKVLSNCEENYTLLSVAFVDLLACIRGELDMLACAVGVG